jgi:phycoerythrin-associated linker protein
MVFGPASRLGVSLFEETPPLELIPGRSEEEVESIIRAVYRQVLGNAYVMESERAIVPESQFKRGQLSVREFVRAIGKSDLVSLTLAPVIVSLNLTLNTSWVGLPTG